jgi:hypothetical protein
MEVYVRGDTPPSQLVQRIRQTVAALLPRGERIRQWGQHTGCGRLGDTDMVRYLVQYESEPGG